MKGQEAGVLPGGVVSGGLSEKVGPKQRPDRGKGLAKWLTGRKSILTERTA